MDLLSQIVARAKSNKQRIVLPEAEEERTLCAADKALADELADIILIGNPAKVEALAKEKGLTNIGKATLIDPENYDKSEELAEKLAEIRKSKGMTLEAARANLLNDYLMFGVMMVKMKDADGMVAGACHATADVLRPSLQILKTAPGVELVSGFFVLDVPDCELGEHGTFLMADCGLNQDPNANELACIANSSARSFTNLVGAKPIVAMLSHSTKGSAKHPLVDKMAEATKIAKEKYPYLCLDGELQTDAAIVPSVARSKAPDSEVQGKANVLIFPNLDAGNIGYKLVQRLAKAEAYGPMLQGLSRPVNDLSRGCSAEDIVGVVALTAVQAQLV